MTIVRVAVLAVLVALAPHLAAAQSLQKTMSDFGLLGVWAPDCSKPTAVDNQRATYKATSANSASLVYVAGEKYNDNAYTISGARFLDAATIELNEEFLTDHSQMVVTVVKANGRIRTFASREVNGSVLIRDGVVTSTGRPTNWLSRCN